MTTEQKYEAVAQAIRQELPRLMEVSEGTIIKIDSIENNIQKCKIVSFDYEDKDNVIIYLKNKDEVKTLSDRELSFCEIIGKEPMLNDVLEWLNYIIYEKCIPINDLGYSGMVKQFYVKGDDGSIIFEILDLKNPDLGLDTIRYGVWNLSSPYLKDQSEELIKFLYNIKINKVMETLKDIFVSYEIAEKLKEIGFNDDCIAFYTKNDKKFIIETNTFTRYNFESDIKIQDFNSRKVSISAPTYEQVFKWFREKGIESSIFTEDGYYYYRGSKGDKFLFSGTEDTYEQAREQLILKLIEIYKNGK